MIPLLISCCIESSMAQPGSSTHDAARGPRSRLVPTLAPALQTKLRIGLAEQSVLVALGHAVQLHQGGSSDKDGKLADRLERAAQLVKQAYSECPSYDVVRGLGGWHMDVWYPWTAVVWCRWHVELCVNAWWRRAGGELGLARLPAAVCVQVAPASLTLLGCECSGRGAALAGWCSAQQRQHSSNDCTACAQCQMRNPLTCAIY